MRTTYFIILGIILIISIYYHCQPKVLYTSDSNYTVEVVLDSDGNSERTIKQNN